MRALPWGPDPGESLQSPWMLRGCLIGPGRLFERAWKAQEEDRAQLAHTKAAVSHLFGLRGWPVNVTLITHWEVYAGSGGASSPLQR